MTALRGFAFRNYRSYGGPQFTALVCSKVNLIAGQNNSGKSNILRAAMEILGPSRSRSAWDRHAATPEKASEYLLLVEFNDFRSEDIIQSNRSYLLRLAEDVRAAFDLPEHPAETIWLPIDAASAALDNPLVNELGDHIGTTDYSGTLSTATTSASGGRPGDDIRRSIAFLINDLKSLPDTYFVDGDRAITSEESGGHALNGAGIIRRLLELENPTSDQLSDKLRFIAIQRFVQTVMEDESLTISIPHTAETIHISSGGLTLPIEHMGTGIHEVVIIAAAATLRESSLFCLEEPELHLHPLLQRKLLKYLAEQTSNTYLIATHSAHMLDLGIGTINHVRHEDGRSALTIVGSAAEQAEVCEDLGYRPSDLVQTNAIIWVEGPSDRIYLNHWLESLAPAKYQEGIHYSIMFYGGALLSALSPLDEPELDEFISLRKMNRYVAILVDSDKQSSRARLNASKLRVIAEFEGDADHSLAWVTWGYTIENYVPHSLLSMAIRKAHPRKGISTHAAAGRWENPLSTTRVGTTPSKVAISREVVKSWEIPLSRQLEKEVQRVIQLIERANRHIA